MKIEFNEDEMLILGIYEEESRAECIEAMKTTLDDLTDDPEMLDLVQGTIEKLSQITDEDYLHIDFSDYDDKIEEILTEAEEIASDLNELL